MNYLSHGYRFLDRPYCLVGTAVPDLMSAADRGVRIRRPVLIKALVDPERFLQNTFEGETHGITWDEFGKRCRSDPVETFREITEGMIQHIDDDTWFHRSVAFFETTRDITVIVQSVVSEQSTIRCGFVGHLLTEVLLDSTLIRREPNLLDRYYQVMKTNDPAIVQLSVNCLVNRPTRKLSPFLDRFCGEAFLYCYQHDEKLLFRMNQVMRRVGMSKLPDDLQYRFPELRSLVDKRANHLLETSLISP